jgi:threonine synthase
VFFVEVSEQNIMDWEIAANRNGHIACTHGGESLAGLLEAKNQGIIDSQDIAIINSTAHALKFAGFQEMYFAQEFPVEYNISPKKDLINAPFYLHPEGLDKVPSAGKPLTGDDFEHFVDEVTAKIAKILDLKKINQTNKIGEV